MRIIGQLCEAEGENIIPLAEARLAQVEGGDLSAESLLESGLIAACVNNDFSPCLQPIIERWQATLQRLLRSPELHEESRHELRCLLAIWWSLFKGKFEHKDEATDPLLVEFFGITPRQVLQETLVAVGQMMVSATTPAERATALLRMSANFYPLRGDSAFQAYMMRVFGAAIEHPFAPHLVPAVIIAAVHTEFEVMPFQTALNLLQARRLPVWMRSWHLYQLSGDALAQVAEHASTVDVDPITKEVLGELCAVRLNA